MASVMVALPDQIDPTLAALDAAVESGQDVKRRPYLGASEIGGSCARRIWYRFRWAGRERHQAKSLYRFEDGYRCEAVMAARLAKVPSLTIKTIDPATGGQIGFSDGHFRGHIDGEILGLLQAPQTEHIWDHKAVAPDKYAKMVKLKQELGEKNALKAWDTVYYVQACIYMHYFNRTRHYMTVSTPGLRDTISVRTNADPETALRHVERAKRIMAASVPPERISNDLSYYECRWCPFNEMCHGGGQVEQNCRTCLHSTARDDGEWHCERHDLRLANEQQELGCRRHLYIPDLVPGEQIDAGQDWVSYRLENGETWIDGAGEK